MKTFFLGILLLLPFAGFAQIDTVHMREYNNAVAAGDRNFTNQNYSAAKSSYTHACALCPSEQYLKSRIKQCDELLAARAARMKSAIASKDSTGKAALLAECIAEGDTALARRDFADARSWYAVAYTLVPDSALNSKLIFAIVQAAISKENDIKDPPAEFYATGEKFKTWTPVSEGVYLMTTWYRNGQMSQQVLVSGNKLFGESVRWNMDGSLMEVCRYKNNRFDGYCRSYYRGKLVHESMYVNGMQEGREIYYDTNGYVTKVNYNLHGQRHGTQTQYFKNDTIPSVVETYSGDTLVSVVEYYPGGTKKWERYYHNGHYHGTESRYHPNGQLAGQRYWVKGESSGQRFWDAGGKEYFQRVMYSN